jgi:hypothetical protein
LLNFIYFRRIFEPAYFIMERKMMLGVKQPAEATATVLRSTIISTVWPLDVPFAGASGRS